MKHKVTVQKLEHPTHQGDWHDPIGRWSVTGPAAEFQTGFPTRREAELYAKCRRNASSFNEAGTAFTNACLA